MPGFGLLPTPPFPPMAQPVIPPTPPVQQPFQASFQAQNEPLTQKPHQQVKLYSQIVLSFFVALTYMQISPYLLAVFIFEYEEIPGYILNPLSAPGFSSGKGTY